MQKPKDLLLIIPLGAPYLNPDLPKVNSAATKLLRLVFRDVVVQNDHAAVLVLATISLTMPRRVSANASRTPLAVIMPRYWRAILSGVYPAFVNSSASETRIRVPVKIKRPPDLYARHMLSPSVAKSISTTDSDQKLSFLYY